MATSTDTTTTRAGAAVREFPDIPAPAALLALVERIAAEFIVRPGIAPALLSAGHPTWQAILAELERELPHRSVAVDFAYHKLFVALSEINSERGDEDTAEHAVVAIADGHFERRAMTMPAASIGEFCARIAHAKALALAGRSYTDAAASSAFYDTIRDDCLDLLREAAR